MTVRLTLKRVLEGEALGPRIHTYQNNPEFGTTSIRWTLKMSPAYFNECIRLSTEFLKEIAKHFHDEEEILISKKYPLSEEHHRHHDELTAKAMELVEELNTERLSIDQAFNYFAFDVIYQHMFVEDKKYFLSL